jgi:hypothetical protein
MSVALEIYTTLPPEAQQTLLTSLLLSSTAEAQLISAANTLQSTYALLPSLHLSRKKREIRALLDEVARESKRGFVRDGGAGGGGGGRDRLVVEIIDSLTDWLGDIWSVVYEYKVNFEVRPRLPCFCYLYIYIRSSHMNVCYTYPKS